MRVIVTLTCTAASSMYFNIFTINVYIYIYINIYIIINILSLYQIYFPFNYEWAQFVQNAAPVYLSFHISTIRKYVYIRPNLFHHIFETHEVVILGYFAHFCILNIESLTMYVFVDVFIKCVLCI